MKAALRPATDAGPGFLVHGQDDALARKAEQDALSPGSVRAGQGAVLAEVVKGGRQRIRVRLKREHGRLVADLRIVEPGGDGAPVVTPKGFVVPVGDALDGL